MTYFAWASGSEPTTFIGPTHPRTGKRSQQGSLSAFLWRSDRDPFHCTDQGRRGGRYRQGSSRAESRIG